MAVTRQNLQARPKILKKIVGTSNQPIKTNLYPKKKYVLYLKSVEEPKIRIGATRQNLQAQPKILKKLSEHQINQSKRKLSQNKYV
jgi:hypothetical protein